VRIQTNNGAPRDFVLTLEPGGLIQFREKGRRRGVSLSIQQAFNRAQQFAADSERKQKATRKVSRGLLALMKGRGR
jgi:hypothetical protein